MNTATNEREKLEESTGLPLTKLTDEEWSQVRDEATKVAAEKLKLPFSAAAAHSPEFIREGYEAAIKGRKGPRGVAQRSSEGGASGRTFSDEADELNIRATRKAMDAYDLSFAEAAPYAGGFLRDAHRDYVREGS